MKKINFTEEQKKEIVRLYENELLNTMEIGKKFNVNGSSILRLLKNNNIDTNLGNRVRLLFKNGKISIKKLNLDEKKIIELYDKDNKSSEFIGKLFNCNPGVIIKTLKRNGIKIKSKGFFIRGKISKLKKTLDDKEIIRMYIHEKISTYKIGKIMNVSSTTIKNRLKSNDIKIRSSIDGVKLTIGTKRRKYTEQQRINRSNQVKDSYIKNPELRETRRKQFKKNWSEMEKRGIKQEFVKRQIERLKDGYKSGKIKSWIKNKTHLEDSRIAHGNRVHTFNNWSSFEPYGLDFNKKFKKEIKERDGCCMLCNINLEDLHLLKRKIHIHHLDYNKLNSFPQNCICLCSSCHGKTQINRNHWTKFFQSLLSERYGYKYTENGEIIIELQENGKDFKALKGI